MNSLLVKTVQSYSDHLRFDKVLIKLMLLHFMDHSV